MKRTPDEVSKALQKLRQEAEIWRAVIAKSSEDPTKVAFGEAGLTRCAKKIKQLYQKSKKQFWN